MSDAEMARLKAGDMIASPAGRLRTVLKVVRQKCRINVSVAILHCSWTHRGHTILDKQMLRSYKLTRRKNPHWKRRKLGRLLHKELCDPRMRKQCDCCDVIGVFQ